jgi:hypothetical protein
MISGVPFPTQQPWMVSAFNQANFLITKTIPLKIFLYYLKIVLLKYNALSARMELVLLHFHLIHKYLHLEKPVILANVLQL